MNVVDPVNRLRAKRSDIYAALRGRGFVAASIPSAERRRNPFVVELVVAGDPHVDLDDLLAATDALGELLGFEVELISTGSALGRSLLTGAVEL